MEKIQMVDLKGQYSKIKDEVDTAIQSVIDSSSFIKGRFVSEFEANLASYLDVKHVISCGNGTDALQLALMALGLKAGDEVITPSFTFIATAEVIALLGLKPVFVDVDINTFNINIDSLKQAITSKTKAIIPVHLFGQSANMNEIMELAKEYDIYIVEDVAQAIGCKYFGFDQSKFAGTIGDIGCTSFFPSKNLGAFGDGGALFTNDDSLAEKIRMIANHGSKVKYHHAEVGVNSRLDAIQAAILDVKLKYLDAYNEARRTVAKFYDDAFLDLEAIQIPSRQSYSDHVFHQYTLRFESFEVRNTVRQSLSEFGIPSMIYYPVPLHLQRAFSEYSKGQKLINAEKLSETVLSLPMHTELSSDVLEFITSSTIKALKVKVN